MARDGPVETGEFEHEHRRTERREEERAEARRHARGRRIAPRYGRRTSTHGRELKRTAYEGAKGRAHLQRRRLLAHRSAAEHRQKRSGENARGEGGRHEVVSAQTVDHRVGSQMGGQPERAVEQH